MTGKKDFFKFALFGFSIAALCIALMVALDHAVNAFAYGRSADFADKLSRFTYWIFFTVFCVPGILGVYFVIKGVLSKQILKPIGFVLGAAVVYVAVASYVAYAISSIKMVDGPLYFSVGPK